MTYRNQYHGWRMESDAKYMINWNANLGTYGQLPLEHASASLVQIKSTVEAKIESAYFILLSIRQVLIYQNSTT